MLFRICSLGFLLLVSAATGCLGDGTYRAGHPCRDDTDCISAARSLFCNKDKLCQAEACADAATRPCFADTKGCDAEGKNCKGACKAGTQTCNGGFWGACTGQVLPKVETCDGADNDCDGIVDNLSTGPASGVICADPKLEGDKKVSVGAGGFKACIEGLEVCTIDPIATCISSEQELCKITPPLIYIAAEGKSFSIGLKKDPGRLREDDEGNSSGDVPKSFGYNFGIGQSEITQKQFQAVMGYIPAAITVKGDNLPVYHVTWHEAAMYANQLTLKYGLANCFDCDAFTPGAKAFTGTCNIKNFGESEDYVRICTGFRLPTEAEWEYAYRGQDNGGIPKDYYNGDMKQTKDKSDYVDEGLGRIATYNQNSDGKPSAIQTRAPNNWFIFDMSGNIGEWVFDRYNASYTSDNNKGADSTGPKSGDKRVWRGGHYLSLPHECRGSKRNQLAPELAQATIEDGPNKDKQVGIGFRIARTVRVTNQ